MNLTLILICIIAVLVAIIFGYIAISRKVHESSQRKEKKRRLRHEWSKVKIEKELRARNESMETGNNSNDFNNSIAVMSELAGKGKHNKPPDSSGFGK